MPPRSRGFNALVRLSTASRYASQPRRNLPLCFSCNNLNQPEALLSHGRTLTTLSCPTSTHGHTRCPGLLLSFQSTSPPATSRSFTSAHPNPLRKKDKSKKSKPAPPETPVPDNAAQHNRGREIDPYDFSELESKIQKALSRLADALARETRNAGRSVSVETMEALPVEIKTGESPKHDPHRGSPPAGGFSKETVRLGEVATVVWRGGRTMQILAHEESYIKPLTASLLSSPHSLNPQPDAHNPLALTLTIPPATTETRRRAADEAKQSLERAMLDVRTARGDMQKKFRRWETNKDVVVDELRKAHRRMEEVVKRGEADGKKLYDNALKALDR